MTDYSVNEDSAVYYSGRYWNDLETVRDYVNTAISGDPKRGWSAQFADRAGKSFKRALILNCGNGWVERQLIEEGLVAEAFGVDYSRDLVAEAKAAARAAGIPARYRQMDVNTARFPDEEFDLVVNFAAAHHIARIDRVFRAIARLLPEDGWFVSYDYVGPHRNQWREDAWEAAWALNRELPESLRHDLVYPYIPAMVAGDPTEAIHSELILETFRRYFTEVEYAAAGGAIAYVLLTHNERFLTAPAAEREPWVERVLEADARFLEHHPDSTLFAYFAGQPRKPTLDDVNQLAEWTADEDEREARAAGAGGEYYAPTALQQAYRRIEEQRNDLEHVGAELDLLRAAGVRPLRRQQFARTAARARPTRVARGVARRARRFLRRASAP